MSVEIEGEEGAETHHSPLRLLRDWLIVIIVALSAAMLVRVYVLQQFYISGPSMETTLFQDNRVLVNKMSYRFHKVHRGDVVVFDRVTTSDGAVAHDDLIKRVIGVEGDSIEIKKCDVYVNGTKIVEPYLNKKVQSLQDLTARCRLVDMPAVKVAKKQLFVMGDNRTESFDSRAFGTISEQLVVGRAFAIVWPLSRIGGL